MPKRPALTPEQRAALAHVRQTRRTYLTSRLDHNKAIDLAVKAGCSYREIGNVIGIAKENTWKRHQRFLLNKVYRATVD